jgi:hypothetical protein
MAKGFIKSMRKKDTGIGFTFEYHMGIKENNLRNHDFAYQKLLVEAKCQRLDTSSMLTLFTKEPSVRTLNDVQLIKKYGYVDENKRPALKDTCVYGQFNGHHLGLNVDMNNKTIDMIDNQNTLVWQWVSDDIKLKFRNLLLVLAENKMVEGDEWFHYTQAFYLENFKETRFLEMIKEKKIVVDLRMHLKPSGASRNHGTGFRLRGLLELMKCYAKSERIL